MLKPTYIFHTNKGNIKPITNDEYNEKKIY